MSFAAPRVGRAPCLIALLLFVGTIYAADIAVNCGGGNATLFGTDANFAGAEEKPTYSTVAVSAVPNPAPQNVYLTNRHVISGAVGAVRDPRSAKSILGPVNARH